MLARRLRALGVVHPFPSALNALVVLGLALLAGGEPIVAAGLALAMLALQFTIGAANDYFDAAADALTKPAKPIPSGLLSRRLAAAIAVAGGALALGLAALHGPLVLVLALVMLGAGLAYDAFLKGSRWAWACFSVAFPALPIYAWYGASGQLPPRLELLLPVAALAGPALQLSNGLVDLERDRAAGLDTLAGRLGHRRALAVAGGQLALVHGLAWLTLAGGGGAPPAALAAVGLASALAVAGLPLSASARSETRERGWQAQAASLAVLAVGWLAAVL